MEAQRSVKTQPGQGAPFTIVHLHGVPVPSRVLGFSVGWYRPENADNDSASSERRFTLLRSDSELGASAMTGGPQFQEVAAA